jgi:flagellar hook-length control protein FliK
VPSAPGITSDVSAVLSLAPQRLQASNASQQSDPQPFADFLDADPPAPAPAPAPVQPSQQTPAANTPVANDGASATPSATANPVSTANVSGGAKSTIAHVPSAPSNGPRERTNPANNSSAEPKTTRDTAADNDPVNEPANAPNNASAQPDSSVADKAKATASANTVTTDTAAADEAANTLNLGADVDGTPVPMAKTARGSGKSGNNPAVPNVNQAASQAQPAANLLQPVAAPVVVNTNSGVAATAVGRTAIDEQGGSRGKAAPAPRGDASAPAPKDAGIANATSTTSQSQSAGAASPSTSSDPGSSGNAANGPAPEVVAQQSQAQVPASNAAVLAVSETAAEGGANRATALSAATTSTAAGGQSTAQSAGAANANALPNFGFLVANNTATTPGAPADATDAAVPLAGLAVAIASRAQAGSNQFDIRLDPPELGRIDVRLDVDGNGQVTSHVTVDRADTLQLLQSQQPQLERALEQAGLKTADNGLQFTLRDQSFAGQNGGGGAQQNAAQLVIPDTELPPVETAQIYSRFNLGGGVDIRV